MLDAAQILQMEHSFNCGTFAGRVCASTEAPIQSSISASIGTRAPRFSSRWPWNCARTKRAATCSMS